MASTVSLKVWGEFALFTRLELKFERMSYPFITASAALGVLDAILFKPQMRRNVQRIMALTPIFPATAVPKGRLLGEFQPTAYHVCVHRFDRFEDFFIYPMDYADDVPPPPISDSDLEWIRSLRST